MGSRHGGSVGAYGVAALLSSLKGRTGARVCMKGRKAMGLKPVVSLQAFPKLHIDPGRI